MKSEQLESDKRETVEEKESRKLAIDWTESEWFAVWLRLARREYHAAPFLYLGEEY